MEHHTSHNQYKMSGHSFRDFLPLIAMIVVVVILTIVFNKFFPAENWQHVMRHFMASFFLVFGTLKLIRVKAFAMAYREYDLLAKKSNFYAHLYPFLEIALGIGFLLNFKPMLVARVTFVVMLVSAFGVFLKLRKKEEVPCACLGMVFKVPMTWVTFIEDIVMAAMVLVMILV